ncbi:COG2932 Predicted transcriptional regulator [Rhabdaerophilaceae bacterium]
MLTHSQIWSAIDALAFRLDMTPSALAKRAGLDATTFNRSKRVSADGHPRWPSTESIAKILAATGVDIDDFMALVTGAARTVTATSLPFRPLDQFETSAIDEAGRPSGEGWDLIHSLAGGDNECFALGIGGNAYAPTYGDGDIIIASPSAPRRRGDKVLVLTNEGRMILASLEHGTSTQFRLRGFDGADLGAFKSWDVRLIARILWVSQ